MVKRLIQKIKRTLSPRARDEKRLTPFRPMIDQARAHRKNYPLKQSRRDIRIGADRARLLEEVLKRLVERKPVDKWKGDRTIEPFVREYTGYVDVLEPYYSVIRNPYASAAEKEKAVQHAARNIRQHRREGPKAPVAEEIEDGSPAPHMVDTARQPLAPQIFTHGRLAALIALRAMGYGPRSKEYQQFIRTTTSRAMGETMRRLQLAIGDSYAKGKRNRRARRSKGMIEGYEENPQRAMEAAFEQSIGRIKSTLRKSRFRRYYAIALRELEKE